MPQISGTRVRAVRQARRAHFGAQCLGRSLVDDQGRRIDDDAIDIADIVDAEALLPDVLEPKRRTAFERIAESAA